MIKILSKAKDEFEIDGVTILPGLKKYNLDTKKRHIRYQLVLLKNEGIIDFNERLKFDMKTLPVDHKLDKEEAEALEKKAAERRERMTRNRKRQVKEAKKKEAEAAKKKEIEDAKKAKLEADKKKLKSDK